MPQQRDFQTEAAYRWPDAYISGEGQFALVSHCVYHGGKQVMAVTLSPTLEKAERAKTTLDMEGCVSRYRARRCDGAQSHVIVDLSRELGDPERDMEVM